MSGTSRFARRGAVGLLGLAAILFSVSGAQAEDFDAAQGPRAVRLSLAEGHVQLSQGGKALADQAVANTPLFEGTQISTGEDARAEVQFEDGSVVRVPPASAVLLSVLSQDETEVTLNSGIGYFELQGGGNGAFKVRFDNTVATASGFTVLRIKMDNPQGTVAVFSGSAHLEGVGAQADLQGGESVTLGVSSAGQFVISENIEPDSWDAWNSDRDQALTAAESAEPPDNNVPEQRNPAWGDLNANGNWYNVPDQGYVWSPYEASNSGWDPYGVGYWMLTPAYGYMWVSGYSWGYMPYRCGYWNWYDMFGWGWSPGPCQTWWNRGGGGDYYFNVRNSPRWYRLPVRPRPPRPRDPDPKHILRAVGPEPVIPVIREPQHGAPRVLPPRDRETPVLLGGRTVEPLQPVNRSLYHPQPVSGFRNTTSGLPVVLNGGARQGYVPEPGNAGGDQSRPTYRPAPIYRPAPGGSGGYNQAPRPVPMPGGEHQVPRGTTPSPMPQNVSPRPAPAPSSHSVPAYHPAPSGGGGGHVSAPAPSGGGHSAPSGGDHSASAPSHK